MRIWRIFGHPSRHAPHPHASTAWYWSLVASWRASSLAQLMVTMGGDLQQGCLADRHAAGLSQPKRKKDRKITLAKSEPKEIHKLRHKEEKHSVLLEGTEKQDENLLDAAKKVASQKKSWSMVQKTRDTCGAKNNRCTSVQLKSTRASS
eukprot:1159903-Pelagomonas_calceolata.AAC.8